MAGLDEILPLGSGVPVSYFLRKYSGENARVAVWRPPGDCRALALQAASIYFFLPVEILPRFLTLPSFPGPSVPAFSKGIL